MSLYVKRREFFSKLARRIGEHPGGMIVLTHCLPDRPELLDALNEICRISLVIAIPYSTNAAVYKAIEKEYSVVAPSMEQLTDPAQLVELIRPSINRFSTYILEIGGYFASALQLLHDEFGESIVGLVEDTENGHQRYEAILPAPYPVVSVARSTLKRAEDALVGPSCVFSIERIFRERGTLLQGRRALVLGYGKVGRGAAHILRGKGCQVTVYDTSKVACALALAEGFLIPQRTTALASADLIVGCSGSRSLDIADVGLLQDGVYLASCSSKRVEFPVEGLSASAHRHTEEGGVNSYEIEGKEINLIANGAPVNYLDNAVIGPLLTLVQAEILFAVEQLINFGPTLALQSINEVPEAEREGIATLWNDHFCNAASGAYAL